MSELSHTDSGPDNYWYGGKVASFEGDHNGNRALFEIIFRPQTFSEVGRSPGDEEIKLSDPKPGHKLVITKLYPSGEPLYEPHIILQRDSPSAVIAEGTTYRMDGTKSTEDYLAYICVKLGEEPRVSTSGQ
jgi:hypothetical protein